MEGAKTLGLHAWVCACAHAIAVGAGARSRRDSEEAELPRWRRCIRRKQSTGLPSLLRFREGEVCVAT